MASTTASLLIASALIVGGAGCGPRDQLSEAVADSTAQVLDPGKAIDTSLAGGQEMRFAIAADKKTFVQFLVHAPDHRLELALLGPDGNELRRGRNDLLRPTRISAITRSRGRITLRVLSLEAADRLGQISTLVEPPRPSDSDDRKRLEAESLFAEAEDLRRQFTLAANRRAIDHYRDAVKAWQDLGDSAEAAIACLRLSSVHEQIGELAEARESLERGLEISRRARDRGLQSLISSSLGRSRALLGDAEQGEESCREALGLARGSHDLEGEAEALNCLGEVHYHEGLHPKAVQKHLEAEEAWTALVSRQGLAETQLHLGTTYSDMSEFEKASTRLEAALSLFRELEDKRGEALALVALARVQDRRSEYQSALNSFRGAMKLVQPMGDVIWQGSILAGIGTVCERMADYSCALQYSIDALELYKEAGLQTAVIDMLLTLGEIHILAREYSSALERFNQALGISEATDDDRLAAYALTHTGQVYQLQGAPREALAVFNRSLELQRSGEDPRLKSYTLINRGLALLDLDDLDRAFESFDQALALSQSASDLPGEASSLFHLAETARARGESASAQSFLETTLELTESLRAGVQSQALRTSYFASIQHYYEVYIDLLMQQHRGRPEELLDAQAFAASERARARSLLDNLAAAGVDVRRGVDPDLLARERDLKDELDARSEDQFRLDSRDPKGAGALALAKEIQDLTNEFDQIQAEIRSHSPRYAALTQPLPLSLQEVQEDILDERTLVLEYSLGNERSFLWAVDKTKHEAFELPSRGQIEDKVTEVYGNLTVRLPVPGETVQEYRTRVRGSDAHYWESATELSEILLGPVADRLGRNRIVVVSDGSMQYLPFAALPLPRGNTDPVPLIVEHEIVNLPSVSALGVIRSETGDRDEAPLAVAVLADPVFEIDDPRFGTGMTLARAQAPPRSVESDPSGLLSPTERALRDVDFLGGFGRGIPRLVATRSEANAILAAAPKGTVLQALDFAANRDRAMSPELSRYRIIHFATHGVVNNAHPGLSGILLSMLDEQGQPQNGFLRLHDIYNLDLPVELVVLSACNTALGKPVEGEGLVGLVRGFMYAGAERVVASLWKVDDEATGELMKRFYQEMLQQGRSPAAALRHAQLAMWRQGEWQSPFYWAAFVLQGEWR